MKKCLILILLAITLGKTYGQDRHITMPEQPAVIPNIEEIDKGYWCAIEIGGGSTVMDNMKNVAMVAASFTNGYRFSQFLKVGAGVGVLYYPNNKNVRQSANHFSVPIFLNARGNALPDDTRMTVPFWSVNVGTSVSDGFFLTPAVGLRIGEKRSAFLLSVAYTLRHLDSYPENVNTYSGALLKLGYEF